MRALGVALRCRGRSEYLARLRVAQAPCPSGGDSQPAQARNSRCRDDAPGNAAGRAVGGPAARRFRSQSLSECVIRRLAPDGTRGTGIPGRALCQGVSWSDRPGSHGADVIARLVDLPRRLLVWLVRGYRYLLSPWLGSACRFHPTCSTYALEALERHGAAAGSYLALCRLGRCHPWCEGGPDPVPQHPPRPWRVRLLR